MVEEDEVNPYDLGNMAAEDEHPIGYLAALKVIRDDGSIGVRFLLQEDVSTWEAVGMLQAALDRLRSFNQLGGAELEDLEE